MHCSPYFSVGKCLLQCQLMGTIVSSMLHLLRCMWCSGELFNCTWSVCLCTKSSQRTIISLCALNCRDGNPDSCIFQKGRLFFQPSIFLLFSVGLLPRTCLGGGCLPVWCQIQHRLLFPCCWKCLCILFFPTPIRRPGPR